MSNSFNIKIAQYSIFSSWANFSAQPSGDELNNDLLCVCQKATF